MAAKPDFPLRVFYDGSCPVCSAKAEGYGRKDGAGRLILVDVSAPGFDPAPFGIAQAEFMYQMHALDRSGRLYRGVEAFRAIWQAFPASRFLGLCGVLIALPLANPLARLAYRLFARLRVYLPKRRRGCTGGSCRVDGGGPG
jgi:predicted DCC family thiol-disulfide oxidoreductase YuxK